MDENLWIAQQTRLVDIYNSANLGSAGDFLSIQGNIAAIAGNLTTGKQALNEALNRQNITTNIVMAEKQRLQDKKNSVDVAYSSTQRMIDLNRNYQKRTWDYTKIIIVWMGVLALYLIMNLLVQYIPVIPSILTDILVLIAVIAAAIYSFVIYTNLQNFNKIYYGQIDPAPPSVNSDQARKNAIDLSNAVAIPTPSGLTTNPSELACLKNDLFYKTDNNVTKCYSNCNAASGSFFGRCDNVTNSLEVPITQGFQNIQANGEYEFSDYSTV